MRWRTIKFRDTRKGKSMKREKEAEEEVKKKRRWPLQFLSIAAEISAAPAIVSARSSAMMDDGRPCYRTTPSHWPGPSRSSLTSRRLPVNPPPPPQRPPPPPHRLHPTIFHIVSPVKLGIHSSRKSPFT